MITFKMPKKTLKVANSRFWVRSFIDQKLSQASSDELNLDYYSVTIEKLPPAFKNANELFQSIRLNFGEFKKGGGSSFSAYDQGENSIWQSENPVSAVMRFDVFKYGANIETMDVVTAHYNSSRMNWMFKPVYDIPLIGNHGDYAHPLAGYRQFGIAEGESPNSYTFYTRGIDRPYTALHKMGSGTVFEGAEQCGKRL